MTINILVFGFYGKGNIGDELFIEAFKNIFAECDFVFTDILTKKLLENASAVFFGGGSFLYADYLIDKDAEALLLTKPIFYIGVGSETEICSKHQELIKRAKLVATRSMEQIEKLKQLNPNTFYCPDVVYSLQNQVQKNKSEPKSVLILNNFEVTSQWNSPAWKSTSWEYFKSEFAQFIDYLVQANYKINFFSMCMNSKINDDWAAQEIINKCECRNNYILDSECKSVGEVTDLFSQYEVVITQRYHGIVLAEMARVPYLAIHHHDKLKNAHPLEGKSIPYYELSKQKLINSFNETISMNFARVLPIESNIFIKLKEQVLDIIINGR